MNRDWRNMLVHGCILIFFCVVCWFLWGTLHLPLMMQAMLAKLGAVNQATGLGDLPGFTLLMMTIRDFVFVPPLLALVYSLFVWLRKSRAKSSWMGFFAATTATLIFLTLPTLVAVLLPVISLLNRLPMR